MHAVPGKQALVTQSCLLSFRLWFLAFEKQFASLLQSRHFHTHVDGRNTVVVRDFLHRTGRRGELLALQRLQHVARESVNETNIGGRIMPPGLADDSLHAAIDLLRWRSAVVYGEFDKQEVGLMLQNVMLETKHAKVRAGSTNGCVYLAHPGLGELLAKPVERLRPPAILCSDASAKVRDAHLRPGCQFQENIWQPTSF